MSDIADELRMLVGGIARASTEVPAGELPASWPALIAAGLCNVGLDESDGGDGGTIDDLSVIAYELGRHAVSAPLLEHSVANWALGAARGGISTVVMCDRMPLVEQATGTVQLRGVRWGRHAARVVICGPSLAVVAMESASVTAGTNAAGEPLDTITVDADAVRAVETDRTPEAVRARLGGLWAWAIVGAAHAVYERTSAYTAGRIQFGKPLVRLPAVAAGVATMKADILLAEATLDRLDGSLPSVAASRLVGGTAASTAARTAHQLHGALGMTLEYPLHRWTRKLWTWPEADVRRRYWASVLADAARRGGESALWDELTAPRRAGATA